ncbi:HS12A-like protein [Mya arenaria]|uniref:HS12A-like protein n=1 Tax=Mya arenaria TaxID=6604 RepID=A0ABY7FWS4_MYAAR|nr:HS12A-like protein [Mya arenaria]
MVAVPMHFTKRVKAGLDGTRVKLALESEAASIWCETLDVDTKAALAGTGTQFMVIDLGGGTADISIQEKKHDENPPCKRWAMGWHLCDANYLKFLEQVFGEKAITAFKTKEISDFFDVIRDFETKKRSYNAKSKEKITFKVIESMRKLSKKFTGQKLKQRVDTLEFGDSVTLQGGDKLRVEPDIVRAWFDNPINKLVEHVNDLLKDPKIIKHKKYLNKDGKWCAKDCFDVFVRVKEEIPVDRQITKGYSPTGYRTITPIYRTTAANPIYTTDPACELGVLITDLPKYIPLSELSNDTTFMFGGTELVVKNRVRKTGKEENLKLHCLK